MSIDGTATTALIAFIQLTLALVIFWLIIMILRSWWLSQTHWERKRKPRRHQAAQHKKRSQRQTPEQPVPRHHCKTDSHE
ncbi:MAG: heme biosynthesis protein HemY [Chloroflexaceae bacterium]|nr:heme biosynthesis protein HemY [Chloroflexaceae bacterium]